MVSLWRHFNPDSRQTRTGVIRRPPDICFKWRLRRVRYSNLHFLFDMKQLYKRGHSVRSSIKFLLRFFEVPGSEGGGGKPLSTVGRASERQLSLETTAAATSDRMLEVGIKERTVSELRTRLQRTLRGRGDHYAVKRRNECDRSIDPSLVHRRRRLLRCHFLLPMITALQSRRHAKGIKCADKLGLRVASREGVWKGCVVPYGTRNSSIRFGRSMIGGERERQRGRRI